MDKRLENLITASYSIVPGSRVWYWLNDKVALPGVCIETNVAQQFGKIWIANPATGKEQTMWVSPQYVSLAN